MRAALKKNDRDAREAPPSSWRPSSPPRRAAPQSAPDVSAAVPDERLDMSDSDTISFLPGLNQGRTWGTRCRALTTPDPTQMSGGKTAEEKPDSEEDLEASLT
jgi:hypothetical protein